MFGKTRFEIRNVPRNILFMLIPWTSVVQDQVYRKSKRACHFELYIEQPLPLQASPRSKEGKLKVPGLSTVVKSVDESNFNYYLCIAHRQDQKQFVVADLFEWSIRFSTKILTRTQLPLIFVICYYSTTKAKW